MEIRNYNPHLHIRLNDLKDLAGLTDSQIGLIVRFISHSVEEGERWFVPPECENVYNNIMKSVLPSMDSYERFLIENLGYTRRQISKYHEKCKERHHEELRKELADIHVQ
jgi:hypothetical protein